MNMYERSLVKEFCRAFNITYNKAYVTYNHLSHVYSVRQLRKETIYIPFAYKRKRVILI